MRSTYIYTSSAVSTQDSFQGSDFLGELQPIEISKEIITPQYSDFIKPMLMRRMGKSTRMSVASAFNCMRQLGLTQPESIIVGTGLGALVDTEKFLSVSTTTEDKVLAPTAFILSGHNTVAGQIALLLKNDLYNMTHVQREVSFEYALLDAILNIAEGKENVLVGAYDELTSKVVDLATRFELNSEIKNQLSEGATFFLVGGDRSKAIAEIKAVEVIASNALEDAITHFLDRNEVLKKQVVKGFIGFNLQEKSKLNLPFSTLCYTDYCGRFFTSSSFGLHMASVFLQSEGLVNDYALVINKVSSKQVALTLLQRV